MNNYEGNHHMSEPHPSANPSANPSDTPASVMVTWREELNTEETRNLDIDTNRWREIFNRPFSADTVESDDFETYMEATGEAADSIDYTVYDRTLENILVKPNA